MQKPTKLIADNPELLLYLDGKLHITVLGGIKLTGFDRLKVTLKIVCNDNRQNAFLPLARESGQKPKASGFS